MKEKFGLTPIWRNMSNGERDKLWPQKESGKRETKYTSNGQTIQKMTLYFEKDEKHIKLKGLSFIDEQENEVKTLGLTDAEDNDLIQQDVVLNKDERIVGIKYNLPPGHHKVWLTMQSEFRFGIKKY